MSSLLDLSTGWGAAGHWTCLAGPLPAWFCAASLLLPFALIVYPSPLFGAGDRSGRVREPILAGSWYEGDPAALADSVAVHLAGGDRPDVPIPEGAEEARRWAASGRHPVAVIVPHAGHIFSGDCAGETFRLLEGGSIRRVVLLGPSHQLGFTGAALPEEDAFRTPLGTIPLDREAIGRLAGTPGFQILERAHAREHSLEIELPFLQKVLAPGFLLIPVVVGRLDEASVRSVGAAVRDLWDPQTVVVVSSDFTHYGPNYGYVPFTDHVPENLRRLDLGAADRILSEKRASFEAYLDSTGATICGASPIRVLLEASSGRDLVGRLIEYYRSGDKLDGFDNSVSYAGIAFFEGSAKDPPSKGTEGSEAVSVARKPIAPRPRPLSAPEQQYLLRLAREAVTALVQRRPIPSDSAPAGTGTESPLLEDRGVFVTLTTGEEHELRGCIGNIVGDQPLLSAVVQNAVAAASRDPRFLPVEASELAGLHLEISVLTPLRKAGGPEDIVIGQHGVVLEKHGRRSVFLPQVAPEQGWNRTQMLQHLALKAGLGPNDWKSGATFYTFEAQVFAEEDAGKGTKP